MSDAGELSKSSSESGNLSAFLEESRIEPIHSPVVISDGDIKAFQRELIKFEQNVRWPLQKFKEVIFNLDAQVYILFFYYVISWFVTFLV